MRHYWHRFLGRWILFALFVFAIVIMFPPTPGALAQSSVTGTPTISVAGVPPPVPNSVGIAKTIQPVALIPGQAARVTIRLTGASIPECKGVPTQPLDAIFVFDISESAGNGQPGSNWAKTRDFTHQLLDQLRLPVYRDRTKAENSALAIVTSITGVAGPEAHLLQDLTQDYTAVLKAVDGIVPKGDTNIADGLRLAKTILDKTPKDRAKAIFLMMHDNDPITATATKNAAREVGTTYPIFIIATPLNITSERQIKDTDVTAMGINSQRFFNDPSPDKLRDLFLSATQADLGAASLKVRLSDEFAPGNLAQISNITQGGRLEQSGKVTWDLARIGKNETVTLSYDVTVPLNAGGSSVILSIGAAGIDCNGYLYNTILSEGGRIAQGPTPTPFVVRVSTLTPTPLPTTPGPSPTPTVTPPYVTPPGPTATRLPQITPPSPPSSISQFFLGGGSYCNDWYVWIPPILLPLLVLLLWILLTRWRRIDWLYEIRTHQRWCWLPCLLLFLYLFVFSFVLGQALSATLCALPVASNTPSPGGGVQATPVSPASVITPTLTAGTTISRTAGISGSLNIGLYDPSNFMPRLLGFNFTDLRPAQFTPDLLLQFDTIVISQVCDIGIQLNVAQKTTLLDWVNKGGKLILYDSDVCGGWGIFGTASSFSVDYSWLPYPFVTNNPGGRGSSSGTFTIVSDDPMLSRDPKSPYYIDETTITQETEIGDANVMITRDYAWCGDAQARNVNNQQGFVHAYAFYGKGLFIYNGLDTDDIYHPQMLKVWQQELGQPWYPAGGSTPPGLTCSVRVFGGAIELWPWLLPLLPLLFLCWWLCRKSPPPPPPPPTPLPPPSPMPPPDRITQFAAPVIWNPGNALVIGLGGSGRWTLTHLKKNLQDAGNGQMPENVRLLLLDTSEAEFESGTQMPVQFAGVSLSPSEKIIIAEDFNQLIDQMASDTTSSPEMRDWFPFQEYADHLDVAGRDIARGTRANRPMGRAALFRQVQQGGENSAILKRLRDSLAAVKEPIEKEYRARVIIVGSLGGGLGSGMLNDVAYLVREVARSAGIQASVLVEAFLIAEGAFRSIPEANSERQKINAFATLRELSRFQLAKDRPYPMTYNRSAPGGVLNSYCKVGLFDNVYLLDTAPYLVATRPEYGVFPALADILTALLDRSSRAREYALEKFRETARSYATNVQANRGEAVVGTIGSLVYRLPLADLASELSLRFAHDLLRGYIVGPNYRGTDLILDDRHNMEDETHPPEKAKELLGWTCYHSTPLTEIWQLLNTLSDPNQLRASATELVPLMDVQNPDAFVQSRKSVFQEFLMDKMALVLNGREGSTPLQARCGKLGYALALLAEIESLLQSIALQLRGLDSAVSSDRAEQARTLYRLFEGYAKVAQALKSDLEAIAQHIVGNTSEKPGAYYHLTTRAHTLESQRAEMAKIMSRQYLMAETLLEEIYRDYLVAQVNENVDRFYWRVVKENGQPHLRLAFITWQENILPPNEEGTLLLVDSLQSLGKSLLKPLWERRNVLLAEILSRDLLNADHIDQTAKTMCDRAVTLAPFSPEQALRPSTPQAVGVVPIQYQTKYFLNSNSNLREVDTLSAHIQQILQGLQVETVPITDPLTCGLMSITEVAPVSAFNLFKESSSAYRWAFGIPERGAQPQIGWREPVHVFVAERNALAFERRIMRDLEMPTRISNPLFVSVLENYDRAKVFALAALGGLLQREPLALGEGKYRYRLQLPNQGVDVALSLPEDASKVEAPLVIAMRTFVLGLPERDPAHVRYNIDELATIVQSEIEKDGTLLHNRLVKLDEARFVMPESAREQAIRDALPVYAIEEESRPGGPEMIAFLRLVALDEMGARRVRNRQGSY